MATNMIIKGWKDVTLGIWEKMEEITKRENEIERVVGFVALFDDMTEDEVLALPLDKFRGYVNDLGWMNTPPDIEQPKETYKINGKEYDLVTNFHKLTTQQYIDFQTFSKDNNYREMLSVFLIPRGHKYSDNYDILEVQKELADMPVQEVLGLMGFFIVLYRSWSRALLMYSSRILRKEGKKNPEIMERAKEMENLADMFGFR